MAGVSTAKQGETENAGSDLKIAGLWRYPVKALMGEELETVRLEAGNCFPYDRAYAIENGVSGFDPNEPKFFPKINFLTQMRHERLALLTTEFEEATQTLTIFRQGRRVASGDLGTSLGRNMIEQFMAAFMSKELKGPPRIHSAPNHHFTDTAEKFVHIINMASVEALGNLISQTLDPARFRANILLEGTEAWLEQNWIGKVLKVGDVAIELVEKTNRCAAINVDPATGARGTSLPVLLNQQFGNDNFGIYGRVIRAGTLQKGASVTLLGGPNLADT